MGKQHTPKHDQKTPKHGPQKSSQMRTLWPFKSYTVLIQGGAGASRRIGWVYEIWATTNTKARNI